eukprot:916722-Prorocentrum_lima.AAC.1
MQTAATPPTRIRARIETDTDSGRCPMTVVSSRSFSSLVSAAAAQQWYEAYFKSGVGKTPIERRPSFGKEARAQA